MSADLVGTIAISIFAIFGAVVMVVFLYMFLPDLYRGLRDERRRRRGNR